MLSANVHNALRKEAKNAFDKQLWNRGQICSTLLWKRVNLYQRTHFGTQPDFFFAVSDVMLEKISS